MLKLTMIAAVFAALLMALVVPLSPASACMHVPETYEGSLTQQSQQAIVFFANGREELLLKIDIVGTSAELTNLGWVIPTPSVPDAYSIADPKIFEQMWQLVESTKPQENSMRNSPRQDSDQPNHGGIELLEAHAVGEFDIQPIRAHGQAAGPALNEWLKGNGYGEIPLANMSYYLERNHTFLAIRVNLGRLAESGATALNPLRISFATDRIVYPLKFSSHQGVYDVTVYLVTKHAISAADLAAVREKGFSVELHNHALALANLAEYPALKDLWTTIAGENRIAFTEGKLTKLTGQKINGEGKQVATWADDFAIAVPEAERQPAPGGAPITMPEKTPTPPANPAPPAPNNAGDSAVTGGIGNWVIVTAAVVVVVLIVVVLVVRRPA